MVKKYTFESHVSVFGGYAPWYFVVVPKEITEEKHLKEKLEKISKVQGGGWKFLPVKVQIGKTIWKTSLLPLGKHSTIPNQKFIALKKEIRKKEGIQQGDRVVVSFVFASIRN